MCLCGTERAAAPELGCELRASGWEASRWLTGDEQSCCSWDSLLGGMDWSSVDRRTARNKLEDLGVDGSTILKRILRKKWGVWIGLMWLSTGASGRAVVKNVMNMWVSESAGGFLDWLMEEQLTKKDCGTHLRGCQLSVCRLKVLRQC